jgi:hypothetical protein
MVDGKPKYVTALGEANEPAGWRPNKAKGGILMDVDSGAILCRGLSMPHSPRWYGGRLWVCESGSGALGYVDLDTGRYEVVAAVPGFARGLDFVGDLAFIGLSQVRESAVFSGIPITERLTPEQRTCGVCVVDLRRGETVALLKFTSGVQEVFAVAVLPRRFPDLINDDEKLLESSFVVPTEHGDSVKRYIPGYRPPASNREILHQLPGCRRPILLPSFSLNHKFPSGPSAIPTGLLLSVGTSCSARRIPSVVICPIRFPAISVNQRFPSAPTATLE